MKIFWQNSKKCLIASLLATTVSVSASPTPIGEIYSDLKQWKGARFQTLVTKWRGKYGIKAIGPLIHVAANNKNTEQDRYIAMMASTQMGGRRAISKKILTKLLNDRSWMIRSAALKVSAIHGTRGIHSQVLARLRDPALTVRVEAVQTVAKLRPKGAVKALFATLRDKKNYRGGRSLWVPIRTLKALNSFHLNRSHIPRLKSLLKYKKDPELRKEAKKLIRKIRKTSKKGKTQKRKRRAKKSDRVLIRQAAPKKAK